MAHEGHVLQAQRIAVGRAAPAVLHPAGLGAQAAVAAARADQGGEKALPGIAHAQRPVDKHLHLDGRVAADMGDLLARELAREDDALHPQRRAGEHPVQAVHRHLRGRVQRQPGRDGAHQFGHPEVLHQHGVHADPAGLSGVARGLRQLVVGEQGVERQVYLHAPQVTIVYRSAQAVFVEIGGVPAGVEGAVAQIDGVRAVLHGGDRRLIRAGGGEQFHRLSVLPE